MTGPVDAVRAPVPPRRGAGGSAASGAGDPAAVGGMPRPAVPWWRRLLVPVGIPVLLYVLARLVDVVLIAVASRHQMALPVGSVPGVFIDQGQPANPGYLGMTTHWDGQWYQAIATHGYPTTASGATADELWRWAFPPVFPMTVAAVTAVTGLSFAAAATLVNGVAGAVAMVLLFALVSRTGGRHLATVAVALTSVFVSAPVLQLAYSEAIGFALLLGALLLLQRRRYGWALLVVLALSLTRLVGAPLALVVAAHLWHRVRSEGRSSVRPGEWVGATALAALSVGGVLLWPLVGSLVVGPIGADRVGDVTARPAAWLVGARDSLGWSGLAFVVLVAVVLILVALAERSRPWGVELRSWSWAYPLFLLAVSGVNPGILRYLLLAAPTLGLALAGMPRPGRPGVARSAWLVVLVLVLVWAQWWYLDGYLVIRGPSHTI